MSEFMKLNFGHHLIPLLTLSGAAGVLGDSADVKNACKSAVRINGALKLTNRNEIAILPPNPDFFDSTPGTAKARNLVWDTLRSTACIQWVILTQNPEAITPSLPSTWNEKGFRNVCIGLVADAADELSEKLAALRKAPVRHRMVYVSATSPNIDLTDDLHGIDWVVFSGSSDDLMQAVTLESVCKNSNVHFLFHRIDQGLEDQPDVNGSASDPSRPNHPFGEKVELQRTTLPGLRRELSPPKVPSLPFERKASRCVTQPIPVEKSREQLIKAAPMVLTSLSDSSLETSDTEFVPTSPSLSSTAVLLTNREDFIRLDGIVSRGLSTFIEVGRALAEIRGRELWRAAGLESWAAYCDMVCGLTKTHANRLINSSETASRLAQVTPIGVTPKTESQVRPLTKLKQPEQQFRAWTLATERANGQPTASLISEVVAELMADQTSVTNPPPSQRQRLIETFGRLRSAIKAEDSIKQVDRLITELERILKLV